MNRINMKMKVIYRVVSRSKRGRVQVQSYLHAVLQLRYERIFGDEGEKLALHGVW